MTSWPDSNAPAADRLAWNRRTLVGAYEAVGTRSQAWDGLAREALGAFAEVRARGDTNASQHLPGLVKQALAAGCVDPLVTYLSLRFVRGDPWRADVESAQAYREAAEALENSGYPPLRKFYASLRAAQAWKAAHAREDKSGAVYGAMRRVAFHLLCQALQEPELPCEEALDATWELLGATGQNAGHEDAFLPTLIDYWGRRWPGSARARLLSGVAHLRLAWNRRGSGYAPSVTEEGWADFARHLEGAERDLEASWRLDPTNPETAVEMMSVELGQGQGRERMELWFTRAMALDPACYRAARAKAWYLQPKWHGSAEDAIAFGRECVRSTKWKGEVPLVLYEVHRMLANDAASGLRDQHWVQPGVWKDVHASFERFLELNPDAEDQRQQHALMAYRCRQPDLFIGLLTELPEVKHSVFGGRAAFDRMVAEAEQATGRKAKLPKERDTRVRTR